MRTFDYKTKGKVLSIDHFSKSNSLPLSFSSCSFILKHSSGERRIFRKLRLGAGIAPQRPKPAAPDCARERVSLSGEKSSCRGPDGAVSANSSQGGVRQVIWLPQGKPSRLAACCWRISGGVFPTVGAGSVRRPPHRGFRR